LPRPRDAFGIPQGDGGILTAEAISGLYCPHLEIVVLSACDTGLGDVAGGEGIFGLQRAFHTAGAQNVVASLWKVDDNATLALMKLFYRQLWQEKQPPMVALRQAQLYIYRHPQDIERLAGFTPAELAQFKPRGLDVVPIDEKALAEARAKAARGQGLPPFYWAAFVLSGSGM
jgi:CHAT domain-containing protein